MSASADSSAYTKDSPFPAVIRENRMLNKPGSAKETRHFVVALSGSGLRYKAGDSAGVFPTNRLSDVDEILGRLGASGSEPVTLHFQKTGASFPLREALTAHCSLSGPTRRFLEVLAAHTADSGEKARLAGLLDPASEAATKEHLAQREFVDLLAEFPGARLSPQAFVDCLRKLMPRLYSIASSPRVHPDEVHLTVAVVRYSTNGRDRVGVCSTFMADRVVPQATPVPVFISSSHFGPPEDGSRDAIMIGPGTGIAPFRAFLQDRDASGASGRNWVFFGDQRRATDYLYEEEWTAWQAAGKLTRIDTAFSRDAAHKVYVQDRMRENGAELWAWIQGGAHLYVCGDAKRMAKDVDAALHEIAVQHGGLTPAAAADFVKALKKDKRYQRDVY